MLRMTLLLLPTLAAGLCPGMGNPPKGHPMVPGMRRPEPEAEVDSTLTATHAERYAAALAMVDFDAVRKDLTTFFTQSQEWWPADFGNYGPFFVRLAWHCSGSYRTTDGRGGCDGGRQRFDPERSWDDNTNLDKARALLWPIKEKYGLGLSWGDLFILAGTTAIQSMGGPILGFCAGRIDDADGSWSAELGPTPLQEQVAPCPVNGNCSRPLGSTTIGLIYLNPEGPMGQPIPELSAHDVRDSFGRMAMNDSETVALIGGGHAFGKTHGACPAGPGPSPKEDPANPWPGKCGTGKGKDAFTSGFEFPWTPNPTKWDNAYFRQLRDWEWEAWKGPGGKYQWRIKNATGALATVGMLTSDISLTRDPSYKKLVEEFAADQSKFDNAFAHAWYKLTTRDMGPVTRCFGNDVPPPQPWQNPLPAPPTSTVNYTAVREAVVKALGTENPAVPADTVGGRPYYGGLVLRLAWQCAGTFRTTDYLGGCNGARIRHSPQRDWPVNAALDLAFTVLEPIKNRFGNGLSWADLIVLAGNVAIEEAGGQSMSFCPGRVDAEDGAGSEYLVPKPGLGNTGATHPANSSSVSQLVESFKVMGLTKRDMTVLNGGGHSLGNMHTDRTGFHGAWTSNPTQLSNDYFKTLLSEQWEEFTVPKTGKMQYKAKGKRLFMLPTDLLFKIDAELAAISQQYAEDNDLFLSDFATAWTKLVNADRFDGPTGNVCNAEPKPLSTAPPTARNPALRGA